MASTVFTLQDPSLGIPASVMLTEYFDDTRDLSGVVVNLLLNEFSDPSPVTVFFDVADDRVSEVAIVSPLDGGRFSAASLLELSDSISPTPAGLPGDFFDVGVEVTPSITPDSNSATAQFFLQGVGLDDFSRQTFAIAAGDSAELATNRLAPMSAAPSSAYAVVEPDYIKPDYTEGNYEGYDCDEGGEDGPPTAEGTRLTFQQRPNRSQIEVLQNGNLLDRARVRRNKPLPSIAPFRVFALDSADSGKRKAFVDRAFVDRREGIGIRDGDDGNSSRKKRIDGDETLVIEVDSFVSQNAIIAVDRVQSAGGAAIQVDLFRDGTQVGSEVFQLGVVNPKQVQSLVLENQVPFDTLHLSAADTKTQFTLRSVELVDAQPSGGPSSTGTLSIDSFEFEFQDPDAIAIGDKVLTERPFNAGGGTGLADTALLIPELGESFIQRLILTAEDGAVENGTFDLTISNPFVDVTSVNLLGDSTDLITNQTDNGEQQVTTVALTNALAAGEQVVVEIHSTITNAITDSSITEPAITDRPLQEYNFMFQLSDVDAQNEFGEQIDLGDAVFNGKIYTSERYFDTPANSNAYSLNEIDNYLITATVGGDSSSLEAEVFTLAGNLVEGEGGGNFGTPDGLHTLYSAELTGEVNPKKRARTRTIYYSDPSIVDNLVLDWEQDPGIDLTTFFQASGSTAFPLWDDLVEQGIFSQTNATTVGKDGVPSELSTDDFTQAAFAGNIMDVQNPPPPRPVIDLTFGKDGNRLKMKATQDGQVIEVVSGGQNQPAPDAGPFDLFAVDSADSDPKRQHFVDRTFFDQGEAIGITDGDDGNSSLKKRIDGDEILGIAVDGFVGRDAVITIDRLASAEDGAEITVQAYRKDLLVDSALFTLGSGSHPRQTLDFVSNGLFDTLHIAAADADTRFTFRSVALSAFEAVGGLAG